MGKEGINQRIPLGAGEIHRSDEEAVHRTNTDQTLHNTGLYRRAQNKTKKKNKYKVLFWASTVVNKHFKRGLLVFFFSTKYNSTKKGHKKINNNNN